LQTVPRSREVVFDKSNGHGPGAVAIGPKNRILAVERTCTDPGGKSDQCKEPTTISALTPTRKVLADSFMGMRLGRINDLWEACRTIRKLFRCVLKPGEERSRNVPKGRHCHVPSEH
jgi:hypothetical protein